MNYTDMNCFETKCQIREARNCESHQEKKVEYYKVSTDAIFIKSQQDSTPSQMHLIILLKKKVNFLTICILLVICFRLLLNFCIFRVEELFHVQLFALFAIIVTSAFVSILYQAWCSILHWDAFSYFDLSEKGAQVSVVVDIDNTESINDLQLLSHVIQRDQKLRTIPVKRLKRSLQENIFEKAAQRSVIVEINNKESVNDLQLRSRYAKFVYCKCVRGRRHRDRDPSRIPVKQLSRDLHKSRHMRKLVRKYVKKNIPKSSVMHLFTNFSELHRKLL